MAEINMDKTRLRRHWQTIRDEIPAKVRQDQSRRIAQGVLSHPWVEKASTVFAYLSFRSEPETHDLIQALLDQRKQVAVPLCDPADHTMKAIRLTRFDQLQAGHYGILEPDPNLVSSKVMEEIPKTEIDLILVPGLAFDQNAFRLGYGGGYYDRYLRDFHGTSIGLAFSKCLTHTLPHGAFDKPVDLVLTDKFVNQQEG